MLEPILQTERVTAILMITANREQARPCERPEGETNLHKLLFANSRENIAKLKHSNTTCRPGGIKLSMSACLHEFCARLFSSLFSSDSHSSKKKTTKQDHEFVCNTFSFFVSSLLISQFARQKTSKTIA
jgi:hypothetical protein